MLRISEEFLTHQAGKKTHPFALQAMAKNFLEIQGDQKVFVHLTITVQSSGAQKLFDHPVLLI